jgi:DNA-binding winged helix-turn-helix (wHTH) protein
LKRPLIVVYEETFVFQIRDKSFQLSEKKFLFLTAVLRAYPGVCSYNKLFAILWPDQPGTADDSKRIRLRQITSELRGFFRGVGFQGESIEAVGNEGYCVKTALTPFCIVGGQRIVSRAQDIRRS